MDGISLEKYVFYEHLRQNETEYASPERGIRECQLQQSSPARTIEDLPSPSPQEQLS